MATSTMAKMKDGMVWKNSLMRMSTSSIDAAVEAGDGPDQRAEGDRRQSRDDRDQQRGACAVNEASEQAAPERVGAEQEVAERRRERLGDDGERTRGCQQRRCGGDGNNEGQPCQAQRHARVADEASPEALHQPTLTRGSRST